MRGKRSWRRFAAWMMPGICLATGVSALGIFAVPLGLVLLVALCWRRPTVEAFGLLAGVGVIVAWIGSINLDYRACTSHVVGLTLAPGGPRSASYSCGGINGVPWIIAGLSAVIAAVILYLSTSSPPTRRGKPTHKPSLSG